MGSAGVTLVSSWARVCNQSRILFPPDGISQIFLRVIAREKDGVYYMSCPRPDSDFDETRTRGASGPKTKFGEPFLAQSADSAGPGASKAAIFGFFEKWFFWPYFLFPKP